MKQQTDTETERRTERVHVTIYKTELEQIDDYRFTARLGSRPDAIRYLASLALDDSFPEKHFCTLRKMKENRYPPVKIAPDRPPPRSRSASPIADC
jgi:hypothetical protein